jgi:hypothetical protein
MASKNVTKLHCPVCGAMHNISNQKEVKCICLSSLVVLRDGKKKQLVKIEDVQVIRKAMQIKCKNCIFFYTSLKGNLGDCLNMDGMKRNIDGKSTRICKKFKSKKEV